MYSMGKSSKTTVDHLVKLLITSLVVLNVQVHGANFVKLTHVDSGVAKGAVCLNGSPPAFALDQGFGSGANNWVVFIEGGAWCNSTSDCVERSRTIFGDSYNRSRIYFEGILDSNQTFNPDFYNWNKVYVANNLTFRGGRIFDAIMDELLARGMKNADNAILSGGSAGGLATILHCDKFRALLPNATRVKCISDSGFFIHGKDLPGAETIRVKRFADVIQVHCLFPENLIEDIKTPIFILESAFDLFQGGGWCSTTGDCQLRVQNSPDTSSTNNIQPVYFDGILSPDQTTNPDFYNWNKVYLRYCDGSSFMGDVEAVDPVTNLHYRGSRIFKAIVEELLTKGLQNAQNVILAGNSAGGLATILNCDRFRAMVPKNARLKCVSDSGFFLRAKDLPNAYQREVYYSQVVQLHGIANFLPKSCTSRMDPGLCFFPENLIGDIETPLFLLNSAFDQYQITVNLKPNPNNEPGWGSCIWNIYTCTPSQLQLIKDFRNTFIETVNNSGDCSSRGLFINSCYIHDYLWSAQRWTSVTLKNKSIAQAIGDWYFDRATVKLIDTHSDHPINCNLY
ncbi:pectinacetylesterase family protein [Striga asiatica]|uniref:Pectin acetylesterase n=1 Tax=Striga asiatica TaxID=4170 RepID=A0A5A7RG77_STRAF|nr:pectinacetylesterase family protein [Striga asiatica]